MTDCPNCKRYREALDWIANYYADEYEYHPNGRRGIALDALREASDWSERDTPPTPTLFKEV